MAEIANNSIFSQTDSSNTGSLPGISGSSAPSQIDDSIRALIGAVKREHDWRNFTVTSTGSANAYVLTYSVAPAAYYTGQAFGFITNFAVTGSATVNVNTLGAKTIKKLVAGTKTNLASGDISSGDYVSLVYDGTDMVWVNKGVASAPSGSITSSGYTQSTDRLLGRTTASAGAIEEISVGSGLSLSAGTLSASGGTAVTVVRTQVFTSSGTYTPHASMLYCEVIATGCGGGGGGADAASGSVCSAGGGGQAGGTAIKVFSAATIGASQTVTIGSAGTAGAAASGTSGGSGGNTTFGALLTANGGAGCTGGGNSSTAVVASAGGSSAGTASSGDINLTGGHGGPGIAIDAGTPAVAIGGTGGASYWGGGGKGGAYAGDGGSTGATAGTAGAAYGSGGGGAADCGEAAGAAGGAGAAGVVYVREYCSA